MRKKTIKKSFRAGGSEEGTTEDGELRKKSRSGDLLHMIIHDPSIMDNG
jgi:hypothetical protein